MKKLTIILIAILLAGFSMKAQLFNEAFDFRNEDYSIRERKTAFIENQKRLKLQPSEEKNLVDSSYYYQWNELTGSWLTTPYRKVKYEYNSQGHITIYKYYKWQASTNNWVDDYEVRMVYDAHGNLTEWVYNKYNTDLNAWEPYEHDTLIYANNILISETWSFYNKLNQTWFTGESWKYNNNGAPIEDWYIYWDYLTYVVEGGFKANYILNSLDQPTETIYKDYDTLTKVWINNSKIESTYQNDSTLLHDLIYVWDDAKGSWAISDQNLYTYINNRLSEMLMQYWTGSAWATTAHALYEFNSGNQITRELIQNWNGISWDNFSQYIYTYDSNNKLTENLLQFFTNYSWVNYRLSGYTYDNNNNLTERLYKRWDQATGLLTSASYKYLYTYNAGNLNTQTIYQRWNTTNPDWVNSIRTDYYYSIHVVFGITPTENQNTLAIYPNPATNMLFVKGLTATSVISIYDLNSKLLIRNQMTNNQIDIADLPAGLYTLRMENSKGRSTVKFIKQ